MLLIDTIDIESWAWVGDCVNSFDEDGECLIGIFRDASDFACGEENAVDYLDTGFSLAGAPAGTPENLKFAIDIGRGVLIGYDEDKDVHHFFVRDEPRNSNSCTPDVKLNQSSPACS